MLNGRYFPAHFELTTYDSFESMWVTFSENGSKMWPQIAWVRIVLGFSTDTTERVATVGQAVSDVAGVYEIPLQRTFSFNMRSRSTQFFEICFGWNCRIFPRPRVSCVCVKVKLKNALATQIFDRHRNSLRRREFGKLKGIKMRRSSFSWKITVFRKPNARA